MSWDLVIRGGHVVDGTGMRGFTADVAVMDGRIARVGRVPESGTREIDAEGYRATIVNGEVLLEDGKHTGALPGMLL